MYGFDTSFTFKDTSSSEVIKLIKIPKVKTVSEKTGIPAKIMSC